MPDMPRDPERTRGRYAVTLDGRAAGMDERFVLGDIAPGVWRVRSTRITARPTSRLETDVRIEADGAVGVALRWVGSGDGVVREARADLLEQAGAVTGTRTVEGTAYDAPVFAGRLDVLAHACLGPLVLAALDGVDVVEPSVREAGDPASFLAPVAARWSATRTGMDVAVVGGVEHAGTAYDLVDARTGRTTSFVVDAGGLVLRSRVATAEGELEVRLMDLDGPWPEPLAWGATD
jgi:hypothetical protein